MHVFEILLINDETTPEDWRRFVTVIGEHVKGLRPIDIVVAFEGSVVRYFVKSRHDISALSQGLDGFLLREVASKDQALAALPQHATKARLLKIPTGGNLLDLKERYKVKNGTDLFYVQIDVQRFGKRFTSKLHTYFKIGTSVQLVKQQLALLPTHLLAVDFKGNATYLKKSSPKYVNIEKATSLLLSDNVNALFSIDTFPYLPHDYYLNVTSYEFDKHSFIIGASGSGKSKFIELFIDRLQKTALQLNYRVVIIDPHASLAADLAHIPSTKVVNFSEEGAQLFPEANADVSGATELTTTLFKSLLSEQYNPSLERVLRFSLFVLFTAQAMELNNLKKFLTDTDYRIQMLEHVKGFVPQNVTQFFGADFNEIKTQRYTDAILPLVSMVDEMQLQPTIAAGSDLSLLQSIQDNFLTVFSLNKVSMGEKVVKTVAGLLIQQIFLLAQARVFGQKVILIIDEVSVVQNPALAAILAEARKFNLSVVLTQQYFGQIEEELRAAIVSNVINYYVFKVSEEDARKLEGNIQIELPKEIVERETKNGLKEADLRVKIMTELSPRECLVRLSANGQLYPALKARTQDVLASVTHAPIVSSELESYKRVNLPTKFVEKVPTDPQSLPTTEATTVSLPAVEQNVNATTQPQISIPQHHEPVVREVGMSMSEVLLAQNSSRFKLRK